MLAYAQFPAIKLQSLVSPHDIAPQDGILNYLEEAMLIQSSGSCLSSQSRQLRDYQCYEKHIKEVHGYRRTLGLETAPSSHLLEGRK